MPRRSKDYLEMRAYQKDKLDKLEALTALEKKAERMFPDVTAMIPGTGPEKVVYNYLLRLKVRFQYQYYQPGYDFSAFPEEIYKPDFILPDYNVIIEIYGDYFTYSLRRRESDLMKWARNIYAGYSIVEHGLETMPEGGSAKGKYIIWWGHEIMQNVAFLFVRDLPEIFEVDRKVGSPDPAVIDRQEAFDKLRAQKARAIKARLKPRFKPFQIRMFKLRKRLFDFDKLNPMRIEKEKELRRIAFPKPPKPRFHIPLRAKLKTQI